MIEGRSTEFDYIAIRRSCLKISGQKGTLRLLEKSVKDNDSKDAQASKEFMVARTFSGWASAELSPHILMIVVFASETPTFSTEG